MSPETFKDDRADSLICPECGREALYVDDENSNEYPTMYVHDWQRETAAGLGMKKLTDYCFVDA